MRVWKILQGPHIVPDDDFFHLIVLAEVDGRLVEEDLKFFNFDDAYKFEGAVRMSFKPIDMGSIQS